MAKNKKKEIFLMNEKSEHCSVMRMRKKHLLLMCSPTRDVFLPRSMEIRLWLLLRPSRRIFILSHLENVWWNLAITSAAHQNYLAVGNDFNSCLYRHFLCIYEITFSTCLLLTRSDKNQQSVDKKKSWCFYWNVRRSFKAIMLIHWRVCVVGGGAQRNFMNVNVM